MILHQQTILLVGASGDIGVAMVDRFLKEGANVIATAHQNSSKLETLASPDRLSVFTLDVSKTSSVEQLCEQLNQTPFDAIVYNPGIVRDSPLLGMEEADWLEVIDINLNGAFRVAKTFGRLLFRKRKGKMLFVSSIAGTRGGRGQANYAASKAGLEAMTRSLAAEMAPRGVLVNALAPGAVESRMTSDLMKLAPDEVLKRIALGRLAKPGEIASLAAHLLAPDVTYITGQTFHIDGGFGL